MHTCMYTSPYPTLPTHTKICFHLHKHVHTHTHTQSIISLFYHIMFWLTAFISWSVILCMLYRICLTFTWFCGITFSGTQRVISFLRQMMEHGGFYRTSDQAWVQFERIQFVGACNPPTDPGRKPLTHRYNAVLDQPGSLCKSSFNKLICLACCNLQSLWEVYWPQCDQPASSCNLQRRRRVCMTLDLS